MPASFKSAHVSSLQVAFYAWGSFAIDQSGWHGFKEKIQKDFVSTYLAELAIWPAFQVDTSRIQLRSFNLRSCLLCCNLQTCCNLAHLAHAGSIQSFLPFPWLLCVTLMPPGDSLLECSCFEAVRLSSLSPENLNTFKKTFLDCPCLLQTFNFVRVPVEHQLLAVNFMTLVDASFLSWARGQESWWVHLSCLC